MDKTRFKQLAKRYFNDELSAEELKEFLSVLEEQQEDFYEAVDDEIDLEHRTDFDKEAAFARLSSDERFSQPGRIRRLRPYVWTAVACSVLIMLGSLFYFNQHTIAPQHPGKTASVAGKKQQDADKRHEDIRLADGTQLALAQIGEKEISYDGVMLSRVAHNLYKINIDPRNVPATKGYHEFTTAKGISYSLLLPDGSKVDLNSGSTLRLDPGFNALNRDCELIGEAYFDVKRNEAVAFRVKTRDYDVKVLGTQFNVKSYPQNNYSQTSLVRGNVHVVRELKEVDLLPGDQVRAEKGVLQNKSKANLRNVLAWKEGYFRFTDASIKEIMNDIVNWYDIDDVDYEHASTETFTGSIVRTRSLNDVLQSIEKISNLRFQIKERRVIVRK